MEGLEKVRVGFIGCGGIARRHFSLLSRIREAEVVALADINPASIEGLRAQFPEASKCQTFTDYKDMLDAVDMDAVEVLTPHTLHFEQAMEALERGLHVLIEKPMVCTVNHARQLISKAEEKGRVVLVSYQRHYQPQFLYIKQVIDSGGSATSSSSLPYNASSG